MERKILLQNDLCQISVDLAYNPELSIDGLVEQINHSLDLMSRFYSGLGELTINYLGL